MYDKNHVCLQVSILVGPLGFCLIFFVKSATGDFLDVVTWVPQAKAFSNLSLFFLRWHMIPQDCFMGCIAGGLVPNWIFLLCCMVLCKRHGFGCDIYPLRVFGRLWFNFGLLDQLLVNYLICLCRREWIG